MVTAETLENQIKRKTQMILFFKEKKFNNGYMMLFNNDFFRDSIIYLYFQIPLEYI